MLKTGWVLLVAALGIVPCAAQDVVRVECGKAPAHAEFDACPEREVELAVPAGASFVVEARAQLAGAIGATGWLPWQRVGADRVRVAVPLDARAGTVEVRVVPGAPLKANEWAMKAEPADTAPLGERTPVFCTHGFWSETSLLPFDPDRNTDFANFRKLEEYRRSFAQFKYYYFSYRPWADYRDIGAALAAEIKQVLAAEAPGKTFLMIGRSGGALPTRYAANDPELAPRLEGVIDLDGAQRGSVGASLLHSNGKVAARIGVPAWLMLKLTQRNYPFSPMVDSLTYDNFDGSIGDGVAKYGVMENTALRAFNETATDAPKLIAYMGDVKNLWGWGDYHVKDEIYRRVLAGYHPSWGTADPLVHKPSGTLEGKPVRLVRLLPGRHHSEVLTDPVLMRMFLLDLYQLNRGARFQALWGGPMAFFAGKGR